MSPSNLIRWCRLAAVTGGLLLVVGALLQMATLGLPPSPYRYLLFSLASLPLLGGLVGLHARQAGDYGRLGTVGSLLAFVGTLLVAMLGPVLPLLAPPPATPPLPSSASSGGGPSGDVRVAAPGRGRPAGQGAAASLEGAAAGHCIGQYTLRTLRSPAVGALTPWHSTGLVRLGCADRANRRADRDRVGAAGICALVGRRRSSAFRNRRIAGRRGPEAGRVEAKCAHASGFLCNALVALKLLFML